MEFNEAAAKYDALWRKDADINCVGVFDDNIGSCYYIYSARVVREDEGYDFTRMYYVKHRRADVYREGADDIGYTVYPVPLDNHVLTRLAYEVNSVQDALEALGWNHLLFRMLCVGNPDMDTRTLLEKKIWAAPFFITQNAMRCVG